MIEYSYSAPGKILLCGEYFVLKGSKALAFPVKWAQHFEVSSLGMPFLFWKSFDHENREWFSAEIDQNFEIISTNRVDVAETLIRLLKEAGKMNPLWLNELMGKKMTTHCDFDKNYGLGTSATLVAGIASWSKTDAQKIQWSVFEGSGYDVRVSLEKIPLVYTLIDTLHATWKTLSWNKKNTENWRVYFVGSKVNSRISQKQILQNQTSMMALKPLADQILDEIEKELSHQNAKEKIHQLLMKWSFFLAENTGLKLPLPAGNLSKNGVCKWLGAWGGDMILADEETAIKNAGYFSGYRMVPFNDLIL